MLSRTSTPAAENSAALTARVSADQLPTLTATGSSATLTSTGPVVIAATADIQAINTLAYLLTTGRLKRGSTLGTLTDSSAQASNALAGARWWAQANGVSVESRTVDGTAVEAKFSLRDGCEIAQWQAAKDVLGSTGGAV